MVMNEALRFESPATITTPFYLKKDLKLGKYLFKKDDILVNNFYGLHHNPSQW